MPLGERRVRVRYPAATSLQWRISAPGFGRNVRTVDGVTLLTCGGTCASAAGRGVVDATRDREDGPLAQRRQLPFVRGLPVIAGQDSLVEVPASMPALPQIEVNEDIAISLRKPQRWASFTVDTIYRHDRAEGVAGSFDDDGAQTVGEHYLEFMQQYYTALTQVSVPSIDDADPLNVRTHEAYRLEWPANEGDALGFALFQLGKGWMRYRRRRARARWRWAARRWRGRPCACTATRRRR